MFIRYADDGKIALLIVYVDDIILTGDDVVEMERLKKSLAKEFEIKDLGSLKYFLSQKQLNHHLACFADNIAHFDMKIIYQFSWNQLAADAL